MPHALRSLAALAALSSAAHADVVYVFQNGAVAPHEHRCASKTAVQRALDWASSASYTINVGREIATLEIPGHTFIAKTFGAYADFEVAPWLRVIVHVDPIDCARATSCRAVHATLSFIQRYAGATCYEQWTGEAVVTNQGST